MSNKARCLGAAAAAALAILPGAVSAVAQAKEQPPLVTYDHAGVNSDREYKRNVGDGAGFVVKIENTCPEAFDFGVTAVPAEPPRPAPEARAVECEPGQSFSIPIDHSQAIGGYIVDIRRKDGSRVVRVKGGPVLNDVKLVISVTTKGWEHDFSSGFTISKLTNPRFGLQTREVDGEQQSFVVEDPQAEDDVGLGAAAFVNVFRSESSSWGLSFGLGISEETDTTYYAGLSWRWGNRGSLTVGYAFGPVDQLPPGTDISQPVDANFLASLDSRIESDLFVSFTYSFLGGADRLKKPFEEVQSKKAGAASPAGDEAKAGSGTQKKDDAAQGDVVATPADLKAEVEEEAVRLTWKAVGDDTSYRIYRSSVSCTEGMEKIAEIKAKTAFVDEGELLVGQSYHYRVSALIGGKESLASDCSSGQLADEA